MIIAGLLLFIRTLVIGLFGLILSRLLWVKVIARRIDKWVDHPWATKYLDLVEKFLAVIDALPRLPRKQPISGPVLQWVCKQEENRMRKENKNADL